jgi:N-methylhydantoinase B
MALSKIIPDRVPAGWNRWNGPSITGVDPRNGQFYVMFGFNGFGGAGGACGMDGRHYIGDGIDLGGLIAPNIETNEVDYPHITEFNEFTTDSCGAGKYRGGCGAKYRIRMYDESPTLVMFGDGKYNPPYGLFKGKPGSCNLAFINEGVEDQRELKAKEAVSLKKGDTFTSYPSGGGGWGNPNERDAELVRADVLDGVISLKSALEDYGCALEGGDFKINWDRTKKLREGVEGSK